MPFENPLREATPSKVNVSQGQATVLMQGVPIARVDQVHSMVAVRRDALSTLEVSQAQTTMLFSSGGNASVDTVEASVVVQRDQLSPVRVQQAQATFLLDGSGAVNVDQVDAQAAVRYNASSTLEVAQAQTTLLFSPLTDSDIPPIIRPNAEVNPLFLANWADRLEIAETWPTKAGTSFESGNTEAVSLAERPKRRLKFTWLFGTETDRLREKRVELFAFLKTMTDQRVFVPLYPDAVEIVEGGGASISTTALSWASTCENTAVTEYTMADGGTLACDTAIPDDQYDLTCRRYHPYKPVAFFATDWRDQLCPETVQYEILDTVSANSITLYDDAAGDPVAFPVFDFGDHTNGIKSWQMVPMVYVEVATEPRIESAAPGIEQVVLEVYEVAGPTALPAYREPYESTPTLDQGVVWPNHFEEVAAVYRRRLSAGNQGRGRFIETMDDRHRVVQEWSTAVSRTQWCSAGGLQDIWDGCKGPWRPFRTSEQSELGECVGAEASTGFLYFTPARTDEINDPVPNSDVSALSERGYEAWSERVLEAGQVCIVDFQGNETYKTVTGTDNVLVAWIIQTGEGFSADIPPEQIQKVYPARDWRFDSDTLVQIWTSPCVLRAGIRMVESSNDNDVTLG